MPAHAEARRPAIDRVTIGLVRGRRTRVEAVGASSTRMMRTSPGSVALSARCSASVAIVDCSVTLATCPAA